MKSSSGLGDSKRAALRLAYVATLILAMSPTPIAKPESATAAAGATIQRGIMVFGSHASDNPKVVTPEKQPAPAPRTVERRCAPDRDTPCAVTLIEMQ